MLRKSAFLYNHRVEPWNTKELEKYPWITGKKSPLTLLKWSLVGFKTLFTTKDQTLILLKRGVYKSPDLCGGQTLTSPKMCNPDCFRQLLCLHSKSDLLQI